MNKKISTLLAAFLAAGFSYTVEAGVVKVTTPTATYKYVVAQDGFAVNTGNALVSTTQTAFSAKTVAALNDATLWTLATSGAGFTFTESHSGVIQNDATLAASSASDAVIALHADGTLNVTNASTVNAGLLLTATPSLNGSANGGDAYLYIVTEAALSNATTYVTVDGKYLVNVGGTAMLVDAVTYNVNGYTPAQAQWAIVDGVLTNNGYSISAITKDASGYAITLSNTPANAVSLEYDKNNNGTDLYTAKDGVSTKVANALKAEIAAASAPTTPTPDAGSISFATAIGTGNAYLMHVNGTAGYVKRADNAATTYGTEDKDAYWNISEVSTGVYEFTNANGRKFEVAGETKFAQEAVGNLFVLKSISTTAPNQGQYVKYNASAFTYVAVDQASYFTFNKVTTTDYQAGELVKKLGDGFNLSIKSKKGDDGVSNFKFNPFQGKLTPVKMVGAVGSVTGFEAYKSTDNATSFLLQCADGIIVLDKSSKYPIEGISDFAGDNGGFQFKVYSKDDMKDLLNAKAGTKAKELLDKTAYNFSISYPNSSDLSEIELIKVTDKDSRVYRVISYGNDNEYYLSAGLQSGSIGTPVYATFDGNAMVKSTDEENNPLLLGYVNLVFQSSNVKVNGNALAMDHNIDAQSTVKISPVEISNVVLGKPEAQWAVTANAAKVNEFTFTNRESGKSFTVDNMYYMGGNKYAVAYPAGTNTYAYPSDVTAVRDTLVIAGAEVEHGLQMDGYANFTALDVLDNQYRLAVASTSSTNFYVTENHSGKHLLGLDKDEEEAATWRLVPLTNAREYNSFGDIKTATDSIYIMNEVGYYNAKGQYKEYKDTLAIISYALQNAKNGEYLTYQNPQTLKNLSMVCDPKSTDYSTSKDLNQAYRFILKEKQNGLYNLVGVTKDAGATAASEFKMNPSQKLFGATTASSGAVEVKAMYKDINSNDLFDLQLVGAPEYRLHNMGDTIRIFRQENDYDVMYEKGEFLNIGNKAQLTKMAPALYVDTAYVKRGHNNRYQYLLVVNPKYVPEQECTIPGHPTIHPDTTYGRFLVNLVDTANVAYRKGAIHTNKYINEGEAGEIFAKLGFVYGFRTADKLYITDKNYVKSGKASDVIDLSTNNFNVAKFAFQYINPINHESDGSFKIQTGYYDYNSYIANNKQPKVSNDGYLKNINGVVVVAKGYEAGDKFDLAAEHSNPTANEGVTASEVSVIAKDGVVIISGAQGKKVTISNVLGQTVANTVISSDKAEIAAPAGVVVVAVEGEAAVKAIVK